jgi:hypothetical protein
MDKKTAVLHPWRIFLGLSSYFPARRSDGWTMGRTTCRRNFTLPQRRLNRSFTTLSNEKFLAAFPRSLYAGCFRCKLPMTVIRSLNHQPRSMLLWLIKLACDDVCFMFGCKFSTTSSDAIHIISPMPVLFITWHQLSSHFDLFHMCLLVLFTKSSRKC